MMDTSNKPQLPTTQMKLQTKLRAWTSHFNQSKRRPLIAILLVATIGAVFTQLSFAGSNYEVMSTLEGESLAFSVGSEIVSDTAASNAKALRFNTNGTATTQQPVNLLATATQVTIRARGDQCKGAPTFKVLIDNTQVYSGSAKTTGWTDYSAVISVPAGSHNLSISFTNDYNGSSCNRNLYVDKATLYKTSSTPTPPPSSTSYYISPNGSDSNTGKSSSSPWKSITKLNNTNFIAGDSVLFEGGKIFSGGLYLDNNDKGTATQPITISSYGTGRATISAGSAGKGLNAYNTAGIVVSNINFVGAGSTDEGVSFYVDLGGNVKLDGVTVKDVEVSGFGRNGVAIGGWNALSGFKNVRLQNVVAHDNIYNGIVTYGQSYPANQNVYIGYSKGYNNPGVGGSSNAGSGIVMGSTTDGVIEYSTAYNNGIRCVANACGVGIWAYDSNNINIQYNESYNNKTGSMSDGGGFDLDNNTTNSVIQYNYSHDNDGSGFMIVQGPNTDTNYNNTLRYNISQNDARKDNHYAGILLYGRPRDVQIYNNTVFMGPSPTNPYVNALTIVNWSVENEFVKNVFIRNNNFYMTANRPVITFSAEALAGASNVVFANNNYYAGGNTPWFYWNNQSYYGLSAWKTASGQETGGGLSVNPLLTSPGNGGTIGDPANLSNLTAYKLQASSPLINKGMDLKSLGVDVGINDFYKNAIPRNTAYDIGAHEY